MSNPYPGSEVDYIYIWTERSSLILRSLNWTPELLPSYITLILRGCCGPFLFGIMTQTHRRKGQRWPRERDLSSMTCKFDNYCPSWLGRGRNSQRQRVQQLGGRGKTAEECEPIHCNPSASWCQEIIEIFILILKINGIHCDFLYMHTAYKIYLLIYISFLLFLLFSLLSQITLF